MKYKNFQEYQQSDAYMLSILAGAGSGTRINFQNGSWYTSTFQTYGYGQRLSWGFYCVGKPVNTLMQCEPKTDILYFGRCARELNAAWKLISSDEFIAQLRLLNIGTCT